MVGGSWAARISYYVLIPSLYDSFALHFDLGGWALAVGDLDAQAGLSPTRSEITHILCCYSDEARESEVHAINRRLFNAT
jgi:hypothetical protein